MAPMEIKQREGTGGRPIRLHIREDVLGENCKRRAPAHSHKPTKRSNGKVRAKDVIEDDRAGLAKLSMNEKREAEHSL